MSGLIVDAGSGKLLVDSASGKLMYGLCCCAGGSSASLCPGCNPGQGMPAYIDFDIPTGTDDIIANCVNCPESDAAFDGTTLRLFAANTQIAYIDHSGSPQLTTCWYGGCAPPFTCYDATPGFVTAVCMYLIFGADGYVYLTLGVEVGICTDYTTCSNQWFTYLFRSPFPTPVDCTADFSFTWTILGCVSTGIGGFGPQCSASSSAMVTWLELAFSPIFVAVFDCASIGVTVSSSLCNCATVTPPNTGTPGPPGCGTQCGCFDCTIPLYVIWDWDATGIVCDAAAEADCCTSGACPPPNGEIDLIYGPQCFWQAIFLTANYLINVSVQAQDDGGNCSFIAKINAQSSTTVACWNAEYRGTNTTTLSFFGGSQSCCGGVMFDPACTGFPATINISFI